jgi:hypothetical protein
MIPDHLPSCVAGLDRSPSANDFSRRRFLQAGAAAGGGLMLSLHLPFATGDAEAAGSDGFAPNAFIRIGSDGQIVLTMPYVEMGQGTYGRHTGNRQLERDTRGLAAPAPSRCDRKNHAGVGGGTALECRSGILPRAKR